MPSCLDSSERAFFSETETISDKTCCFLVSGVGLSLKSNRTGDRIRVSVNSRRFDFEVPIGTLNPANNFFDLSNSQFAVNMCLSFGDGGVGVFVPAL